MDETSMSESFSKLINAQTEFMNETYLSLNESITASFNTLVESLADLYKTSRLLGKKLSEETSNSINKYETKRLRAFGRFRINLDSTMRGVKEDILRGIRTKLGFTPTGEPIFTESTDIPDVPSAVYIAETFANTRELINRGFKKIENETKEILDDKKRVYFDTINSLSSETQTEISSFFNKHTQELTQKKVLLDSLLNQFQNKLAMVNKTTSLVFEKLISDIVAMFEQKQSEIEVSFKYIVSDHFKEGSKITSDSVQALKDLSLLFDSEFEEIKSENRKDKFNKISGLLDSDIKNFNQRAKEINQIFRTDVKSVKQHNKRVMSDISNLSDIQKKIEVELTKCRNLAKTDSVSLETSLQELSQLNTRLSLTIEEIKEKNIDLSKNFEKRVSLADQLIVKQEKQLTQITAKEKELDKFLWQTYVNQVNNLYQRVKSSFQNRLQKIGIELSELHFDFEHKLNELNEKTMLDIHSYFSQSKEEVNKKLLERRDAWEEKYDLFNTEIINLSKTIQDEIVNMIEENRNLVSKQNALIDGSINKIANSIQIDLTQLFNELRVLFEEMAISILNLVNNLESKLGEEYEIILDYFEKTKETTLGTAKTILDDLSSYTKNMVDSIWTTVLKELNALQEYTNSSTLAKKIKNIIRETNVKVEQNVENRNKEAKDMIDIFSNSIKVTFEELKNRLSDDFTSLEKEIVQTMESDDNFLKKR
ncbi:MAG: hypothetical protein ACTSQE_02785 [Candidatus Heimdallarchaeaceae archaeon]